MLHMGTLVALLAYFWRDLWRYFVAFLRRAALTGAIGEDRDRKLALLLAISVVPGALMGVLLEGFIDTFFREQLLFVCALLVVGAVILFIAERAARHIARWRSCAPRRAWHRPRAGAGPLSGHQPLGHHHLAPVCSWA